MKKKAYNVMKSAVPQLLKYLGDKIFSVLRKIIMSLSTKDVIECLEINFP